MLACAALLAWRRWDQLGTPQFWAEDGSIFFLQSRTLGAAAFIEPAAGYFHTVLRVVAWLAAQTDLILSPAIYVVASALLTLYVAARTQSPRFPLPPSPLYAFAVVLIPDGYEVLLNLTNVQWILGCGLILVLIAREPTDWRGAAHDVLALLALGLTGPFSIVLAPLFIWRVFHRRTRFSTTLAWLAGACAATQLAAVITHPAQTAGGRTAFESMLAVIGTRVGGSLFSGGQLDGVERVMGSLLGGIVIGAIVWLAVKKGPSRTERMWLGCAFFGLGAAAIYRCRDILPNLLNAGPGGRYFYPLQLLALWLLLAITMEATRWFRRVAAALLVLVLVANFARLREPPLPDMDWQFFAAQLREGTETVVVTNPNNWEFTYPGKLPRGEARSRGSATTGLVNASVRSFVTPARSATLCFVIHSSRPKKILVRAVGPALAGFGVADPLRTPVLRLLRDGVEVPELARAQQTRDHFEIKEAAERCGAFAIGADTGDVVALVDLGAGSYSALVSGGGSTGEVLLEVYEVPQCWYPPRSRWRLKDS